MVIKHQSRYAVNVVGIEIVYGCNFKCRMCPVTAHGSDKAPQFMELDTFHKIVEMIDATADVETIYLFNFGEPLMHPQFREILEILNASSVARKANVIMFTNASLLEGKKAEALFDVPIVNHMYISFDGVGDKESFELLRGSHYDKVIRNIRDFAESAKKCSSKLAHGKRMKKIKMH